MKRWIVAALALVAVSALAQSEDVIVEFRAAPLIAASRGGKTAMSTTSYRATFTRFRADLTALADTEIRQEYFEVFNGAAVRASRAAIPAIERLPYVKRVHLDHQVQAMAGAAVAQIGADKFWTTFGSRGKGVVVAVIDTGIDYN